MKRISTVKLAATAASLFGATTRPGAPTLSERVQCLPRLVRATLDRSYAGTSTGRLALVAAALAYVASPVDLVPELVLPVIGLADDALVLSWAVRTLVDETDRFLAWELGQGRRGRPTVIRGTTVQDGYEHGGPDGRDGQRARDRRGGRDGRDGRDGRGGADGPGRPVGALRMAATDRFLESVRKRLEP